MPFCQVPSTNTNYALMAFDRKGREHADDPDGINGRRLDGRCAGRRATAAVALGLFATGVAVSVVLISSHNRPFTGEISVGPDVLLQVMPESRPVRLAQSKLRRRGPAPRRPGEVAETRWGTILGGGLLNKGKEIFPRDGARARRVNQQEG